MRFFWQKNRVWEAIQSQSWVGLPILSHRSFAQNIRLLMSFFLFWAQTFFSIDLRGILTVEFRKNTIKSRFILRAQRDYEFSFTAVLLNLSISWCLFFCFAIRAIFSEIEMILCARVSWLRFRIYKNASGYSPISCYSCRRASNSRERIQTQLIRGANDRNTLLEGNFTMWGPIRLSLRFWYRQNLFNVLA